jgi:hypothetical protein
LNFVAHIAVGVRSAGGSSDDLFLAGTALPDFAAMARVRLTATDGRLGQGIAVHHATDRAFHASDWFLELEQDLRRSLSSAGLPDGGARVCAHVGPELLLDGALIADPAVTTSVDTVYRRLSLPDPRLVDAAVVAQRAPWARHLERVGGTLDSHLYMEPTAVGQLLWRIARRRPRLRFGPEHIPTVVAALEDLQPRIDHAAHDVVAVVAAALLGKCTTK